MQIEWIALCYRLDLVMILPVCVSETNTHTFCHPKGIAKLTLIESIQEKKKWMFMLMSGRSSCSLRCAMSDVATMWINQIWNSLAVIPIRKHFHHSAAINACHRSLSHYIAPKLERFFFHFVAKNSDVVLFQTPFSRRAYFFFFSRDRRLVFGSWSVQIHNTNTYEVYGGSYYRLFQYLHQKGVFLAASKANLMLYRMTANQHECKTLDSIQLGLLWFIHLHRDWVCEPNCCSVCVFECRVLANILIVCRR